MRMVMFVFNLTCKSRIREISRDIGSIEFLKATSLLGGETERTAKKVMVIRIREVAERSFLYLKELRFLKLVGTRTADERTVINKSRLAEE